MTNKTIEVGDISVKPGKLKTGWLKGIELPWGARVDLPLVVLNGEKPGPTYFLQCAAHGIEMTGIPAVRRVCREILKPKDVSGAIVAVCGGNPFGMMFGKYWNPLDWQDISGKHPGNEKGYASDRMGKALWDAVEAVKPDYAYDMHCNPYDYPLTLPVNIAGTTWAMDNDTGKSSIEIAKASGLTVLTSRKGQKRRSTEPRGLGSNCMSRGIPCMTSEFGWGRHPHGKHVDIAERVLLNIFKHVGMIDGDLEKHTEVPVLPSPPKYVSMPTVQCNRGGLMEPTATCGEFVKEGTTIAKIYSPHGDLLEDVPLPFDGSLYSYFGGRWAVTFAVTTGTNIAWTFAKEG